MSKLTVICVLLLAQVAVNYADICDLPSVHDRVDCHPEGIWVTKEICEARQCCWVPYQNEGKGDPNEPGVSWCYFSGFFSNYIVKDYFETNEKIQLVLAKTSTPTGYDLNSQRLMVDIDMKEVDKVRIRITDPKVKRFEVPLPILNMTTTPRTTPKKYYVSVNETIITVSRVSTGVTMFKVDLSKMIYAEQYIQLVVDSLPSDSLFGMGQRYADTEVKFGDGYRRFTFLNKEGAPKRYMSLYGTHPFYLMKEQHGKPQSHGVLIFNNHPSEVVLHPSRKLVYRTIGGIIDVVLFVGETSNEVIESKNQVIGLPNLPPLWSLGFQLCRYGYESTRQMNETMRRNLAVGVPVEVQWADIDYMENRNDFTIDPHKWGDLPQFVEQVHKEGRKFMPILDPAVSASEPHGSYPPFDYGMELDVFIKSAFDDNQLAIGKVWNPETSAFPDFTNPLSDVWWSKMMIDLRKKMNYDGMWIDMNEPSNMDCNGELNKGCPNNKLNNPQYVPGNWRGWFLWKMTICPSSKQYLGNHYDLHNMYGFFEAVRTFSAFKKMEPTKRPFILSRSSATGQGAMTAAWTGDIDSSWEDLRQSIHDIVNFNLYGIPMAGADICGFTGPTTNELCARWLALGAFYPFSRSHNTIGTPDQDPAVMGQEVINAAKNSLEIRYKMLPYFYTQLYQAATKGTPFVRSMTLEYPSEPSGNFEGKMLLGDSVLIAPALWPGQQSVMTYFPRNTIWYNFVTKERVMDYNTENRWVNVPTPIDQIPVFIKGGSVIPLHRDVKETTGKQVNESTFELFVALDRRNLASGKLFFDSGDDDLSLNKHSVAQIDVEGKWDGVRVNIKPIKTGYVSPTFKVTKVTILGFNRHIKRCQVKNGNSWSYKCSIATKSNMTTAENLELIDLNAPTLTWFQLG